MVNYDTVESAREFFYKDKFAVNAGITLDELTEDKAVCSLKITDDHRNAYGGVMGGVIFTLADFAFAVLSNQIHQLTVAQQVSINYLSAPKGEKLIADKMKRLEDIRIKGRFDYSTLQSLSTECRQKLIKHDPETLAEASRIPGVSPSDINVLLVLLNR